MLLPPTSTAAGETKKDGRATTGASTIAASAPAAAAPPPSAAIAVSVGQESSSITTLNAVYVTPCLRSTNSGILRTRSIQTRTTAYFGSMNMSGPVGIGSEINAECKPCTMANRVSHALSSSRPWPRTDLNIQPASRFVISNDDGSRSRLRETDAIDVVVVVPASSGLISISSPVVAPTGVAAGHNGMVIWCAFCQRFQWLHPQTHRPPYRTRPLLKCVHAAGCTILWSTIIGCDC